MQNHGFTTIRVNGQARQQPHMGAAPIAMMGSNGGSSQRSDADVPPTSPTPGTGTVIDQKLSAADGSTPSSRGMLPVPGTIDVEAGPRTLPGKDLRSDDIEDSYVQFIFYCNPKIPLATDTAELRRGFQSMPKTDGRTFEAFKLFELIRKFEAKEIETWSQLVMDMGVKQPDVASGQSTQKVQQYAVRLKRWLHAFHIDAFFQYSLGKSNSYFTDIPTDLTGTEASIRDGVPPEEDLALRALVPKWRPKRGRRPNDEGDHPPSMKRQLRAASLTADDNLPSATPMSAFPQSAYPQSAFPWDRASNQRDPWAAAQRVIATPSGPRGSGADSANPQQTHPSFDGSQLSFYMDVESQTQHPQSAISPRPLPAHSATTAIATPQSAHPLSSNTTPASTSSPASRRKRHGPSVSAAWANDGSSASGKLRGRPPSNRSTQDGPFSTFPARQSSPQQQTNQSPLQQSPSLQSAGTPGSAYPSPSSAGVTGQGSLFSPQQQHGGTQPRKPSKLQLQVPQHSGGPVRLATPPAQQQQQQHALSHGLPQLQQYQQNVAGGVGGGQLPRVLLNGTDGATAEERRTSADFFNGIDDEVSELGPEDGEGASEEGAEGAVDWRRRALVLKRKVVELEAELKGVRRRVLEAVM